MPGPVLVQSAFTSSAFSTGGPTAITLTANFPNPVTPGNTIIVLGGMHILGLTFQDGITSITDGGGDTIVSIVNTGSPFLNGDAIYGWRVFSSVGGFTGVTAHQTLHGNINWELMILEFSGMSGASVVSSNSSPLFGGIGNFPFPLNVTDSLARTVTVTFNGSAGSGGPGTNTAVAAIDFLVSGADYILGWVSSQSGTNVPTATFGYTFSLLVADSTFNLNSFLTAINVSTGAQPQIFVVT